MPGYGVIQDSEVMLESESRKPVTVSLLFRLRDNPVATAGGASGAPRVQEGAIDDTAIDNDKLANNSITGGVSGNLATSGVLRLDESKLENDSVPNVKLGDTLTETETDLEAAGFFSQIFIDHEMAFVPVAEQRDSYTGWGAALLADGASNDDWRTQLRAISGFRYHSRRM